MRVGGRRLELFACSARSDKSPKPLAHAVVLPPCRISGKRRANLAGYLASFTGVPIPKGRLGIDALGRLFVFDSQNANSRRMPLAVRLLWFVQRAFALCVSLCWVKY